MRVFCTTSRLLVMKISLEFFDDDDGKGGSTPTDHQPTHTTDDAAQRKRTAIAKNIGPHCACKRNSKWLIV